MPCNNKRVKDRGLKGLRVIDDKLDVANFIRFHLQTRGLLKQLFTAEKRKAAKNLLSHLHSDQAASVGSSDIESDGHKTTPNGELIHTTIHHTTDK